jgi:hypothetical protein
MAAADVWVPAHNAKITYNAVVQPASSVELSHQADEFETTNTESDGDHEFGVAGRTRQIRWTQPAKAGATMPLEEDLVDAVYGDDKFTWTGKARIVSSSRKGGGKGGYVLDYTAKFTGVVTKAAVV